MNENINLVEILKDCPKGTKLYSTVHGRVELVRTQKVQGKYDKYPVKYVTPDGFNGSVTAQGLVFACFDGECTLFPSKEQRDWSKFTAPWYKKETDTIARIENQGEQASSQTNERAWLYLVSDVLTWKDGIGQYLDDPRVQDLAKRLCSEYAQKLYNPSNTGKNATPAIKEQRDALMKTMADAGYEWDAEKKELRKLVPNRFDPKTLQPFDKVLVRDNYKERWLCRFFSHIEDGIHAYKYATIGSAFKYCIPYNDDTKHLLCTKEEAPKYYRYWED